MKKTFKMLLVQYPEPHLARTRQILKKYPEVKELFGNTPSTAWYVFGIVSLQIALAWLCQDASLWVVFLMAYALGAFANHALFVMIHECTHNLVFKSDTSNSLLQIFANFPIIFPSAMSFRIYHMKHHLYQGQVDYDADLPRDFEVRWVGNSTLRKTLWYLVYFVSQLLRIPFLKGIPFLNAWVLLNLLVQFTFLGGITYFFGWKALLYLALSTIFSVGLHPVGGRWIQEHYVLKDQQETYSYYGPLNHVSFNVGYHNEHHDLMKVAWSRLPQVKKIAPEFYESLYFHVSWTKLLLHFILDPKLGLFSRVTRTSLRAPQQGG